MAGRGHFSLSCSVVISKAALSMPISRRASLMPATLTPSLVRCAIDRRYDRGYSLP